MSSRNKQELVAQEFQALRNELLVQSSERPPNVTGSVGCIISNDTLYHVQKLVGQMLAAFLKDDPFLEASVVCDLISFGKSGLGAASTTSNVGSWSDSGIMGAEKRKYSYLKHPSSALDSFLLSTMVLMARHWHQPGHRRRRFFFSRSPLGHPLWDCSLGLKSVIPRPPT